VKLTYLALAASTLLWPLVTEFAGRHAGTGAEELGRALALLGAAPSSPVLPLPPSADAVRPGASEPTAWKLEALDPSSDGSESSPPQVKSAKRRTKPAGANPPSAGAQLRPRFGIRVAANTVLRLANARAVPAGTFVPAEAARPAGMRLSGVSALGVGLQDGDVLTHVAGAPATSRGVVVSRVLEARAARANAISAIFWRAGEPWQLVVEMPYLRGS
jgi:hypothetical protein